MGILDEIPRDIISIIAQEFVGKPVLSYLEDFMGTTLAPDVDFLGLGRLQIGDSRNLPAPSVPVAGSTPVLVNNELQMELTGPPPAMGVVAVGAFALPFPRGMDVFSVRAVFAAPSGPHTAADTWALGVYARDGGLDDLDTPNRIAVTFQVPGTRARVNTPKGLVDATTPTSSGPPIPQAAYDALFNLPPGSPDPEVSLELLVDRVAATCRAIVYMPNHFETREFTHDVLLKGGNLSVVGAGLAMNKGTGTVRAKLRRFEVYGLQSKGFLQERFESLLGLARQRLVDWAFRGLPRR